MVTRSSARRVFGLALVALLLAAAGSSLAYDPVDDGALGPGTVERDSGNVTVVSTQGVHFAGQFDRSRPPRLLSIDPDGSLRWQYEGDHDEGARGWFYDIDPLPNGNLLVVSPRGGETLVYELDRETRERVWTERLPFTDTHDVDRLDDGRLVVAHMRADVENGTSGDRVVVWNRSRSEVTWEWRFADHFPADTDGGVDDDWTHVNDVDPVGEDRLLVSPRNFDQVLLINRTTGEIEIRLGSDGDLDTLDAQHNPDYLRGPDGRPTLLVADSGNDRVVEYAREGGDWNRTWTLTGNLTWPRDADRLPNGNTLVVDSLGHRVIEVTPRGRVVWEFYATWAPYDAERLGTGDGSNGPTVQELNATGRYTVRGGAGESPGVDRATPQAWLDRATDGTPAERLGSGLATWWAHRAPWFRPAWLSPWGFLAAVLAFGVAAAWLATEAYWWRGDAAVVRLLDDAG
ncbi:aryl-sulfate sulfotransferase [Haloplanus pelagicus]|uniref:aryl-sulfate sulfotransferase n=1 Tax=Haloplanus pelagicus TaxID=2949995 RepID=UPI00203DEF11|nr:aryl-sulfate sulfotransferase [Haloplanus sp. HW8-1]